ncbi:serine/threonine protein kinase [Stieleria varia]|uniref:Serine/threonine-protein kinase PknD n=1 Tax=Stieleria varia TaxID=2528005 RepID=A0A5C6B7S7_9BACT|nr:serine/threonine-protein kinase [Stieleria varia]TWU08018.1 Serine/threonine-protein kinase PknD [Stieleria varia]
MQSEPTIILSATDPDLPNKIPSGIDRYTGLREIARGGNGLLRSAFDPVTGRTVAIKSVLPPLTNDVNERRRLLREARVTAQLQHPNTVPVYDIGRDLLEGVYFVMKRISGENLFQVLKRIARKDEATAKAFPIPKRIDIIEGACQALAYAHARGVIHRDVKPENIWVGNFGEVYLLDWGVAKVWGHVDDQTVIRQDRIATRDPGEQLQTLTGGGQRPGTPLYMSPEQVRGNRGLDERSDVFNVGVCLYEALVIREPFRGTHLDETFDNILNKDVTPPSEAAPEIGIPKTADAVVMRALEKQPAKRFQSMREMIDAIQSIFPQTV